MPNAKKRVSVFKRISLTSRASGGERMQPRQPELGAGREDDLVAQAGCFSEHESCKLWGPRIRPPVLKKNDMLSKYQYTTKNVNKINMSEDQPLATVVIPLLVFGCSSFGQAILVFSEFPFSISRENKNITQMCRTCLPTLARIS